MGYEAAQARRDFLTEVRRGNIEGHRIVDKFGRAVVGTDYTPIAFGGAYRTPQIAGAVSLRVKAGGSADDTADGDGARSVYAEIVDIAGAVKTYEVDTAGESASAAFGNDQIIRLRRFGVAGSGTYATQAAGSMAANITLEDSGGVDDWGVLDAANFPKSQSEIGVYTTGAGKRALLLELGITVDTTKTSDLALFYRPNILQTAPPYSPMRLLRNYTGVKADLRRVYSGPLGPVERNRFAFQPLTDIGFMGKVSATTSAIEVDMQFLEWDVE